MGQDNDECFPAITGAFFTLTGIGLMVFGLMCLISSNVIGATVLAFGTLCLAFGVFLIRTVCHGNVYTVELSAEKEFEINFEMTAVISSQGLPIGRIQNWTMQV